MSGAPDVRCVLPARALLGEGPLWDAAAGALYWVDIRGRRVHRWDPATGHDTAWPTPEPVGSLLAQASQQHPWIDLARPAGIENPNYYLYPPLFAILFAPMTLLPVKLAYVAWVGMGAVCLALSIALLLTRGPLPRRDPSAPGP